MEIFMCGAVGAIELYIYAIAGALVGCAVGYLYGLHVCIESMREVLRLTSEQILEECKARGIDIS